MLHALADRWSTVVPTARTAANPYEGTDDLNSEAAIALDGALFMEGGGRPVEITAMIAELRTHAEGFAGAGSGWLPQCRAAGRSRPPCSRSMPCPT